MFFVDIECICYSFDFTGSVIFKISEHEINRFAINFSNRIKFTRAAFWFEVVTEHVPTPVKFFALNMGFFGDV